MSCCAFLVVSEVIDVVTVRNRATRDLWIGSAVVSGRKGVPRHRGMKDHVFYADGTVTNGDLVRIMSPGDMAHGNSPGKVTVLRLLCAGGTYYIVRSDAWGVDSSDPNDMARQIGILHRAAEDCEIKPMRTLTGTARRLFMDRFDGGWLRSLPPRWRGLAHEGIHGGPVTCISGGGGKTGRDAVCMDIHRSYWRAMCEPMPVIGPLPDGSGRVGRYVATAGHWDSISQRTGVVEATVRVTGPSGVGALPPLATRDPMVGAGHMWIYPTGEFRGVWPISNVREAEERGEAEVIDVHQAMISTANRRIFLPFMRYLDTIPKDLAKSIYTRLYGSLATRGGWEGRATVAGEVEWISNRVEPMDPKAPPTYRPDIAALITGHNHTTVLTALRSLRESDTIATHVDSIWTHDIEGAQRLDPEIWRAKKLGPVRYYGTGTYVYWGPSGPECSAQGYDSEVHGPPSPSRLATHVSNASEHMARTWEPDYPWRCPGARSKPPELTYPPTGRSVVAHPDVSDRRWKGGAWNG